ncbi:MAG: hypothetical protein JWN66_3084 [Sphingomonas bacterium]|uniref:hypothetical protein n=1 Tax=Sphingomonas bacterium TaxID=1895847 RepID=UPI0026341330|nr:hypothetical protein [Sphingomonas bacterium]MDB5705968.1 hypothetical protein [Sphingomonas bacterium]
MKRPRFWIALSVPIVLIAVGLSVAVAILPSKHTLDQCSAALRRFELRDMPRAARIFYGCEEVAEEGVATKNVKALRFGGRYHRDMLLDDVKARYFFDLAIKLGDEQSKIDLLETLDNSDAPGRCEDMSRIVQSYKPATPAQARNKAEWIDEIRSVVCR